MCETSLPFSSSLTLSMEVEEEEEGEAERRRNGRIKPVFTLHLTDNRDKAKESMVGSHFHFEYDCSENSGMLSPPLFSSRPDCVEYCYTAHWRSERKQ
mmetsp:Transcript_48948/g.126632  ORF Transcript_48948/g.126632 Transcript_48948/m.126632 type:complete len:98 (+) Transcript_48948:204-497(+)